MKDTGLKKYWIIFLQLQKINIMRRIAYPISFLIGVFAVFLTMFLSVLFINVNFSYINNLSGWTYYQVLAVVGSYMITEGLIWVFTGQLNSLNHHIEEGTLDGIILRPINSQFLVSFWRGDLEDITRIISGFSLVILAIKNTIGFNIFYFLLFILLLLNGLIMLYSFNLIIRCISFWIIDGSGLWIFMERITSNSQYPVDIYYHKLVRNILTFIIPLAFVSTVPAKILTNHFIDWKLIALSFSMMIIFFSLAIFFWRFSLKHYSSASS